MANKIANQEYKVITVTPTLVVGSPTAFTAGDVFFAPTEIPNVVKDAGGCSKLIGIGIVDQSDQGMDLTFVFMQRSEALGTVNAAPDITDSNLENAAIQGVVKLDFSIGSVDLGDSQAAYFGGLATNALMQGIPMLLQAASGTTSMYVSAIVNNTPTLAAVDDVDLLFHIQR
tara:strand:- start:334 stop:849 length:516 start_codon:yes stop_codon:yes gene_type:complete